jgi:hypothetical protein
MGYSGTILFPGYHTTRPLYPGEKTLLWSHRESNPGRPARSSSYYTNWVIPSLLTLGEFSKSAPDSTEPFVLTFRHEFCGWSPNPGSCWCWRTTALYFQGEGHVRWGSVLAEVIRGCRKQTHGIHSLVDVRFSCRGRLGEEAFSSLSHTDNGCCVSQPTAHVLSYAPPIGTCPPCVVIREDHILQGPAVPIWTHANTRRVVSCCCKGSWHLLAFIISNCISFVCCIILLPRELQTQRLGCWVRISFGGGGGGSRPI